MRDGLRVDVREDGSVRVNLFLDGLSHRGVGEDKAEAIAQALAAYTRYVEKAPERARICADLPQRLYPSTSAPSPRLSFPSPALARPEQDGYWDEVDDDFSVIED